jgi:parallel beta-helix repeat protein
MKRIVFSIIMIALLFLGIIVLGFNVRLAEADSQTVVINADGYVTPSGVPIVTLDNTTYSLTGDISYPTYYGIVIQRNNILIDGNGYTVQGYTMFDNNYGLDLMYMSNVTIENINVRDFHWGITLFGCSNCIISGNNATENLVGIDVAVSTGCVFSGNNATENGFVGIEITDYSDNNIVSGNNVVENGFYPSGAPVEGGIFVSGYSTGNTVEENNVIENHDGMYLGGASDTKIYHNNFEDNFIQVYTGAYNNVSSNIWSDAYPSGGNYWSDYTGKDLYSGPNQDLPGSDGIGDKPYVIGDNTTDSFPLMQPGPSITFTSSGVGSDFTGTIITIDGVDYGSGGGVNKALPALFWRDNGSAHAFAFQSPLIVGSGAKQYVWNFTAGLSSSQSGSIIFNSSGSVTGNYVTCVHDVTVTNITADRNWTYQGRPVNVNITVLNKGDFNETVNVTLYYNMTAGETIGTQNATITTGEKATLSFEWNTNSAPYNENYTLTAVATISPADYTPADNTLASAPITVRIIGDIDGDGKVDGNDMITVAWSFGAYGPNCFYPGSPPSPRWNQDADIDQNLLIDGSDLIVMARNFGK